MPNLLLDVPVYPEIATYFRFVGNTLHILDGDGWKDESMAWKTGVYVASNLSGPQEFTYKGPQAQELLSRVSINDVYKWPIGTSKHLVMTDQKGLIANHGLVVRDADDTFRQFASAPWPAMMNAHLKMNVALTPRQVFILQVAGPLSLTVLEKLIGEDLRGVGFLAIRKVSIPGIKAEVEMEVSRIGMAGTLAYELRGPLEHGPAVFDAVYQAGKPFDIKRLGWRTYIVNHTEAGFPQMACNFLPTFALPPSGGPPNADLAMPVSGSIDPADLRARCRTPHEVNWGWMAKFDHDFIGRTAVEAEAASPRRTTVTLRWNKEDIVDIFASQFQPGEEYKILEFPCVLHPRLPGGHADLVTKNGRPVGIASAGVYSYYYRELISHGVLDIDQAEIGNEVIVHWGDFGKRIKQVRATVERFPYQDLPTNKNYDLRKVPSGLSC